VQKTLVGLILLASAMNGLCDEATLIMVAWSIWQLERRPRNNEEPSENEGPLLSLEPVCPA
jgi:hypothetical protein